MKKQTRTVLAAVAMMLTVALTFGCLSSCVKREPQPVPTEKPAGTADANVTDVPEETGAVENPTDVATEEPAT
ncbi:MAG: hypothetical protein II739_03330, partial [Clostridia bacterium]|nr:hypothetical protein [Clostridia bacterium]